MEQDWKPNKGETQVMATGRAKYRRITDLYVTGTELVLKDGSVMWLQVLNPYEMDETRHDAQVARARMVMALKGPEGGDERDKVEGVFRALGRNGAIEQMAEVFETEVLSKVVDRINSDPDWKERISIMDRSQEILARPAEDPENELLERINREYLDEVARMQKEERDGRVHDLKRLDESGLLDEFIEVYQNRRGGEVARLEYELTEAWFATRVCDAVQREDGTWDHTPCNQHRQRVFETKSELRELPEELQRAIFDKLSKLNMTVWQAKNADRPGSSSDSSPRPSAVEESTPSTSIGTPDGVPGTSAPPSTTP